MFDLIGIGREPTNITKTFPSHAMEQWKIIRFYKLTSYIGKTKTKIKNSLFLIH